MTNETTASQPKSIWDDAKFRALVNRYAKSVYSNLSTFAMNEARQAVVDYIDSRAPAAQASATIQAAPEGWTTILVNDGFGPLICALDRASRKGYLPDALTEEWEAFKFEDAPTAATIQAAPDIGRTLAWLVDPGAGSACDKVTRTMPDDALRADVARRHGSITELVARPAATSQEPVMVAEPVGDELHFNAQRLRNVALLVGLTGAIPDDDATLDGARGAVLGMIAGRLRGEAKIDALAAQMVADPAGVALATLKRYPDSAGPGRGEMFRVVDVEALFAATVKAVPSEALDAAPEIIGWYRDEQIDVNSDSQGLPERLVPHRTLTKGASRPRGDGWKAVVEFAAPLADKTGGGE